MKVKLLKFLSRMSRLGIYVLIAILSVSMVLATETDAQRKFLAEISINLENKGRVQSLMELVTEIEAKSSFTFAYLDKSLNKKKIDLEPGLWQMDDLLREISIQAEVSLKRVNESIAIVAAKKSLLPAVTERVVAQQTISGKVTDENGEPLPGVSIFIDGTAQGTVTDIEGNYRLTADDDQVLVFSFIGYARTSQPINGRSVIDVKMQVDETQLEAIVVTALGISRESRSLPYSTQSVEAKELTEVRDPNNVINSLQGKVANALINQSSGGVGSEARIILRGNSSISGDNSALIVVDGVPNSRGVNINPDDIESMTLLNGAAAAALYGSQAGNGVVVITTKKGSKERVSVNVNSGITFNTPFSLPDFQNEYGQGSNGVLDATSGENWGEKMNGQQYTNLLGESRTYNAEPDNVKDFFKTGVNATNAISVSGGGEKAQGYLSYTHSNVSGIVPNNELVSHNINLRLTNQITEKLSTDAKVTYFVSDVDGILRSTEGNTAVLDAYQIPRNMSIEDVKNFETTDEFGVLTPAPYPSTLSYRYQNPYWVTNYDKRHEDRNQIFGYLSAKYQLTDWLSIKGRANLDKSTIIFDQKTSQGTVSWATRPGGYFAQSYAISTTQWYDLMFDGSNRIGESFNVDYHVGTIYNDRQYTQDRTVANGLNVTNKFSTNFATNPVVSNATTHVQTQSVFGLANFSYKDMLFLDASLRNDWDSRLPAPHSFQYYSLGGSGILSEMLSMPEYISLLKLSASYAEVGNGGQFGLLTNTYSYSAGVANGYISRGSTFSIPGLKPEIVKSLEFGLSAKFLNNRYSAQFTYYKSNSINQLLQISLPAGTGYNSQYINAGDIQNSGVEIILKASPIVTKAFDWTADFNVSFNNNEVKALSEGLDIVYLGSWADWGGRPQIAVGGSYGDLVASKWARNDDGEFLVSDLGVPILSGAVGEQPSLIGNFNPDAILGLSNSFRYKDISVRLLIDGRVGGIVISGTEANLAHSGITESTLPYREGGWNLGGVNTDGDPVNAEIDAQLFWQTVSNKRSSTGEFFAYDATNFRVRELSVGYSLPLGKTSFIQSVKLSFVARNLLWLYRGESLLDIPGVGKRKMWFDPDVSIGSLNSFQGIEYGMPSTRSVGFNLNLSF